MSRKPPKDQDYFYAPNTPYPKDKWIHIPYVRYSRRESLLQNLAMGCSCAFSLLLFIATIFFNGLGNEYNASLCPVSEPVRRTLTAICGLLTPIAFVLFVWLDRYATAHTWTCIFTRAEVKFYVSKGKRVYRTRKEQENHQVGMIFFYITIAVIAILTVWIAITNLSGGHFELPDFLME